MQLMNGFKQKTKTYPAEKGEEEERVDSAFVTSPKPIQRGSITESTPSIRKSLPRISVRRDDRVSARIKEQEQFFKHRDRPKGRTPVNHRISKITFISAFSNPGIEDYCVICCSAGCRKENVSM